MLLPSSLAFLSLVATPWHSNLLGGLVLLRRSGGSLGGLLVLPRGGLGVGLAGGLGFGRSPEGLERLESQHGNTA